MRIIALFVFFSIALSLRLLAYKDGPLPNMTGGFGGPSCRSCHLDNPPNAPGGTLRLDGIPRSYVHGQTYRIVVTLARPEMKRGGFEMAARFASGRQKGKQAGTWRALDERARVISAGDDPSLQFTQHTTVGTVTTDKGVTRWTVEWTAPKEAGSPVQFNAAANASNDDASPLGDFIYLKEVRIKPSK